MCIRDRPFYVEKYISFSQFLRFMGIAVSRPESIGLVWGLAATRRSVCIRQMNRMNSRDDLGHDDSTTNIVVAIIISYYY